MKLTLYLPGLSPTEAESIGRALRHLLAGQGGPAYHLVLAEDADVRERVAAQRFYPGVFVPEGACRLPADGGVWIEAQVFLPTVAPTAADPTPTAAD